MMIKLWCVLLGVLLASATATALEYADLSLVQKAKQPITKLKQIQTESDFTARNYGSSDCSNIFYIKPIIPIEKNAWIDLEQLIRIEFQVVSLAKSSTITPCTTLGDTQFFDLFLTETDWGRWGVGPMFIFPTATKTSAGQGKWQAGPACGISFLQDPRFQFGFLAQNPIAFAGNSHLPSIVTLLFQPILTIHLEDNWYINANPQWSFQWNPSSIQIPLNLGIGRVFSVGSYNIDASLDGEWLAYKKATGVIPQFTLQLSVNLLLGK